VTDPWDRRLLLSLLQGFFTAEINSQTFSLAARYTGPDFMTPLAGILKVVGTWPTATGSEDVGLSANASTITARNEAVTIFHSIIEVQPTLTAASEVASEEEFAVELVESLQAQVPRAFNVFNFLRRFDLADTVSTVLHHEILLYNTLMRVMTESLESMRRGLKGLIMVDEGWSRCAGDCSRTACRTCG
jgi:hypothetical protein